MLIIVTSSIDFSAILKILVISVFVEGLNVKIMIIIELYNFHKAAIWVYVPSLRG